MIVRALSIAVALGAVLALWLGYGELRVLRGTLFWEYRFIVFAVVAFLGLSALEWAMGWIKAKVEGDEGGH